jgi:predicted outer membrane repeat protein
MESGAGEAPGFARLPGATYGQTVCAARSLAVCGKIYESTIRTTGVGRLLMKFGFWLKRYIVFRLTALAALSVCLWVFLGVAMGGVVTRNGRGETAQVASGSDGARYASGAGVTVMALGTRAATDSDAAYGPGSSSADGGSGDAGSDEAGEGYGPGFAHETSGDGEADGGASGDGAGGDGETDTETENGAETESEAETETEAETEAETGAVTETESEAETEADAEINADSEASDGGVTGDLPDAGIDLPGLSDVPVATPSFPMPLPALAAGLDLLRGPAPRLIGDEVWVYEWSHTPQQDDGSGNMVNWNWTANPGVAPESDPDDPATCPGLKDVLTHDVYDGYTVYLCADIEIPGGTSSSYGVDVSKGIHSITLDGVWPRRPDGDYDGDGIPDELDDDLDGDGIPNATWDENGAVLTVDDHMEGARLLTQDRNMNHYASGYDALYGDTYGRFFTIRVSHQMEVFKIRNMNCFARVAEGMVWVKPGTACEGTVLEYENVAFKGPQMIYNIDGGAVFRNVNVTMDGPDVGRTGDTHGGFGCKQEVAQLCTADFYGYFNVYHDTNDSTGWYHVFFWYPDTDIYAGSVANGNGGLFKMHFHENANVHVTSVNRSLTWFDTDRTAGGHTNGYLDYSNLDIYLDENASFTYVGLSGFTRKAYDSEIDQFVMAPGSTMDVRIMGASNGDEYPGFPLIGTAYIQEGARFTFTNDSGIYASGDWALVGDKEEGYQRGNWVIDGGTVSFIQNSDITDSTGTARHFIRQKGFEIINGGVFEVKQASGTFGLSSPAVVLGVDGLSVEGEGSRFECVMRNSKSASEGIRCYGPIYVGEGANFSYEIRQDAANPYTPAIRSLLRMMGGSNKKAPAITVSDPQSFLLASTAGRLIECNDNPGTLDISGEQINYWTTLPGVPTPPQFPTLPTVQWINGSGDLLDPGDPDRGLAPVWVLGEIAKGISSSNNVKLTDCYYTGAIPAGTPTYPVGNTTFGSSFNSIRAISAGRLLFEVADPYSCDDGTDFEGDTLAGASVHLFRSGVADISDWNDTPYQCVADADTGHFSYPWSGLEPGDPFTVAVSRNFLFKWKQYVAQRSAKPAVVYVDGQLPDDLRELPEYADLPDGLPMDRYSPDGPGRGGSPSKPVKSIRRAVELLSESAGHIIYILGTVDVVSDMTLLGDVAEVTPDSEGIAYDDNDYIFRYIDGAPHAADGVTDPDALAQICVDIPEWGLYPDWEDGKETDEPAWNLTGTGGRAVPSLDIRRFATPTAGDLDSGVYDEDYDMPDFTGAMFRVCPGATLYMANITLDGQYTGQAGYYYNPISYRIFDNGSIIGDDGMGNPVMEPAATLYIPAQNTEVAGREVLCASAMVQVETGGSLQLLGGVTLRDNHNTLPDGPEGAKAGQGQGGGVFATGGLVYATYDLAHPNVISGNAATNGGAIAAVGDGAAPLPGQGVTAFHLSLAGVVLSGNEATTGGGVYLGGSAAAYIGPARFEGNLAQTGGGLYGAAGSTATVGTVAEFAGETPVFSGNAATGDGGAIYSAGDVDIIEALLGHNSADGGGGGVFNAGTMTVDGAVFEGNQAGRDGGAIYNAKTLDMSGGFFADNAAAGNGGALCIATAGETVFGYGDYTVSGNKATHGNAIYQSGTLGVSGTSGALPPIPIVFDADQDVHLADVPLSAAAGQSVRECVIDDLGLPAGSSLPITAGSPYAGRDVVHGAWPDPDGEREYFPVLIAGYMARPQKDNIYSVLELAFPDYQFPVVYVDGTLPAALADGSDPDGEGRGGVPSEPVRTLKRAYQILASAQPYMVDVTDPAATQGSDALYVDEAGDLRESVGAKYANVIYVMGQVTVDEGMWLEQTVAGGFVGQSYLDASMAAAYEAPITVMAPEIYIRRYVKPEAGYATCPGAGGAGAANPLYDARYDVDSYLGDLICVGTTPTGSSTGARGSVSLRLGLGVRVDGHGAAIGWDEDGHKTPVPALATCSGNGAYWKVGYAQLATRGQTYAAGTLVCVRHDGELTLGLDGNDPDAYITDDEAGAILRGNYLRPGSGLGDVAYGGAVRNYGMVRQNTGVIEGNRACFEGDTGGGDTYGGAIANLGAGEADIHGLIRDNSASHGGGVANIGPSSLLTIADHGALMSRNMALAGMGGHIYNAGGALVSITKGTLSEGCAKIGGGGIYNDPDSTVTLGASGSMANIEDNASAIGGGVCNQGNLYAEGLDLERNTAFYDPDAGSSVVGDAGPACGGGIYNDGYLYLGSALIDGNETRRAYTDGAAAGGEVYGMGGAIYNTPKADGSGGVLDVGRVAFTDNGATAGGAVYSAAGAALTLGMPGSSDDPSFAANRAVAVPEGGAGEEIMAPEQPSCTMAEMSGCGGAVYNAGTLTANNVTAIMNEAVRGGVLYNAGTGSAVIGDREMCVFFMNEAQHGGAIYNDYTYVFDDDGAPGNEDAAVSGAVTVEKFTMAHNAASDGQSLGVYQDGEFTIVPGQINFGTDQSVFLCAGGGLVREIEVPDRVIYYTDLNDWNVHIEVENPYKGRPVVSYTSNHGVDAQAFTFTLGTSVPECLFLVESAEDDSVLELQNWQIYDLTLPAEYFLVFRQDVHGTFLESVPMAGVNTDQGEADAAADTDLVSPTFRITNHGTRTFGVEIVGFVGDNTAGQVNTLYYPDINLLPSSTEALLYTAADNDLYLGVRGVAKKGGSGSGDGGADPGDGGADPGNPFATLPQTSLHTLGSLGADTLRLGALGAGQSGTFEFVGAAGNGFIGRYMDPHFPLPAMAAGKKDHMRTVVSDAPNVANHARAKWQMYFRITREPEDPGTPVVPTA